MYTEEGLDFVNLKDFRMGFLKRKIPSGFRRNINVNSNKERKYIQKNDYQKYIRFYFSIYSDRKVTFG